MRHSEFHEEYVYVDGCMGDKRKQIEIKRVFLFCVELCLICKKIEGKGKGRNCIY